MSITSPRIVGILLLLLATCAIDAPAQEVDHLEEIDRIGEAFAKGDARKIVQHASDRIELSIFGNSTLYSRSQATYVLQEFFRAHRPSSCEFEDVSAAGDSQFATGYLQVNDEDEPLRVFVRMRANDDTWKLREVRIERVQ